MTERARYGSTWGGGGTFDKEISNGTGTMKWMRRGGEFNVVSSF